MREAQEAVEREEAERERWLQSSEAVQERKRSRLAFADIDAAEARQLLPTLFAEQFAKLNSDPARFLSDAQLVRPLGEDETAATVSDGGNTTLMEAGMPVRTEDEQDELRKVDLSLEATAEGFVPTNPLIDLAIPSSAEEAVRVGDKGLSISAIGVEPGREAQLLGDENVYYHDILEDTGMMVSPISGGVELFNILYSEESPETLRYDLDLPEGAVLRPTSTGGAEIVREGNVLALVPFPTAVDAQGTDVPVEMKIEGDSLALHVAHRDEDYALPILVDPILENWGTAWYFGTNLKAIDYWKYDTNDWPEDYFLKARKCISADLCSPSNAGLFITSVPDNLPANTWGHWYYVVPGSTTFIPSIYPAYSAHLNPFWRNNHGCNWENHPRPYDYDGSFDAAGKWIWFETNRSMVDGTATMYTKARGIAFGMSTGNGGSMPCWRSLMLGGTVINLDDEEAPTLHWVSGVPSGWFGPQTPINVSAYSSDAGLGVKWVTVTQSDWGKIEQDWPNNKCTGIATEPCPGTLTSPFKFTALSLGEGIRTLFVAAQDPLGKGSTSYEAKTMVDRSQPEVTLDGQLAEATEEDLGEKQGDETIERLRLPVYKLTIDATDGDPKSEKEKDWRSGVKDIQVFLDGVEREVPWSAEGCPGPKYSCPMKRSYELELVGLDTGLHTLKVIAVDQVGNPRERSIEFEYFPATGMKDEYAMHYFPLPDGLDSEKEEEHPARPELAVNVMNGNLVYRERDFEVPGAAADLELERFYNSQLPDSESTEWGEGWTLAETPELDPEEGPAPSEAEIVDSSGALDPKVELPTKAGEEEFDPELQATITKEADGGYELTDDTGESATSVAFSENGRAEALRTEGYAKVDYKYESGLLTEIEVQDPATFAADYEELEELGGGLIEKPTFAGSFGTQGSGDGQLNKPADVAVDSAGNLWVADKLNNRIQKFGPDDKFLAKFGSSGTGNGQFSGPAALAIDAQGNIWVADGGNRRVQKFNSKGEFLLKFGSQGTGNGQFSTYGPRGIAIDAQGNAWVSDYSGRIQKFNSSGQFLQAVGTKGSGNGQFGESAGLDVGAGKIWVGDWTNNRVSVFSEAGTWLFSFGTSGSGDGQFKNPDTVEVDKEGNVWVGDQNNYRVQQFNSEGKFLVKFGSFGSGSGQFNFAYPLGVETDGKGRLWVADVNNNRVQEWLVPIKAPVYESSFGTSGSGDGQFSKPADVAVNPVGNLLVADRLDNRIQRFSSDGKFLAKFGSSGSGNGQFSGPVAVAVDSQGNIWVADSGNRRVQKFNVDGEFLLKFGSQGSGNGQFSGWGPRGIAIDTQDNVWVSDYSGRIQKFDSDGKFILAAGSQGSGNGQFGESAGLDVGLDGRVWVGDWTNNRVSVFSEAGAWLFSFGTSGSGNGQFNHPDTVEVDSKGNVYVGDQSNQRVQQFDSGAKYVRQFGGSGSGPGQFNFIYPLGIETDSKGNLWVADVNNHRIQHWRTANYEPVQAPPIELSDGDPAVDVESEGGLVASVEGNAAGEHHYEHEGSLLTSHDGPNGETAYEYDEDRLTKVTLANGTWGEVEYHSDGRVKSVTVAPEGANPETTFFHYSDEPRRTTVIPPNASDLVYDIGADGSVLKWWNKLAPPELSLAGTLYDNREEDGGLIAGDHSLEAEAYSPEGMASIEIIVNGDVLVSEATCKQKEGVGCVVPPLEDIWVAETGANAPGHLTVEVIATDHDGMSSSERFWVDIPEPPPPPPPGSPVPPTFKGIKQFREEYGLEIVFPVAKETELFERIQGLITAWWNPQTPAGEVARASWERWGVPLRAADVAELEYREWFYNVNAERIDQWVETTSPGSYAGYYMDHPAGGIMRIGFLGNQPEQLANLETSLSLAGGSRLSGYPTLPTASYLTVQATSQSVLGAIESNSTLADLVVSVEDDEAGKATRVGTPNVTQVEGILDQMLGANAPVAVEYEAGGGALLEGRYRNEGRMRAGDYINSDRFEFEGIPTGGPCTAGFGAEDRRPGRNGDEIVRLFLLTAGHCAAEGEGEVWRNTYDGDHQFKFAAAGKSEVGRIKRSAFHWVEPGDVRTDGSAIRIDQGGIVPLAVWGWDGHALPTEPAGKARKGNVVCYSGAISKNVSCGKIVARSLNHRVTDGEASIGLAGYWVRFPEGRRPVKGDSGSPVWNLRTGASIGLVSFGRPQGSFEETLVAPLLHPPNMPANRVPGILHHHAMAPLRLKLGG